VIQNDFRDVFYRSLSYKIATEHKIQTPWNKNLNQYSSKSAVEHGLKYLEFIAVYVIYLISYCYENKFYALVGKYKNYILKLCSITCV
jgi:hypothetical protein